MRLPGRSGRHRDAALRVVVDHAVVVVPEHISEKQRIFFVKSQFVCLFHFDLFIFLERVLREKEGEFQEGERHKKYKVVGRLRFLGPIQAL